MTTRLRQSREREIVSSRLQKRAEIKMIQAQINPHFLYNTLNVIHSIAELNRFSDISLIAKSLSSMYRYNIKSKEDVTIQNELEQLENYINIQKIRFPGKFTVVYDIAEELHSLKILKFLLQPIVENSFYHGLEPRGGKGTVEISILKRGFVLYLRIKDNGVGISEEKVIELNQIFDTPFQENSMDPRMNFGLYSVHARIKNVYGDHYSIKVSSKLHVGTSIEMIIPVEKEAHTYEYYGS
jgi:two-component system sensor histidine kinase YesM